MKHIEVYVRQKYSAERRIIFNSPLSVLLACITGALWAKRDERGILREARDEGRTFSSPEPVVPWSRGWETRGSGSSRYRMSENFWHPVAQVQKLQISLLMLLTDFCPSLLHWWKNFTSWALSREWLLWDVWKCTTSLNLNSLLIWS